MNALLLFNTIQAGLMAMQELAALLQKAANEKRDVTNEEIDTLRTGNDLLSGNLINRLDP